MDVGENAYDHCNAVFKRSFVVLIKCRQSSHNVLYDACDLNIYKTNINCMAMISNEDAVVNKSDIGFLWFQCWRSTAKINEAGFGFFSTVTKLSLMRRGKITAGGKITDVGKHFPIEFDG